MRYFLVFNKNNENNENSLTQIFFLILGKLGGKSGRITRQIAVLNRELDTYFEVANVQ